MNGLRPGRGRAGAGALVVIAAIAIAQALSQGSSITAVYARPSLPTLSYGVPDAAHAPKAPPASSWVVYPPDSGSNVVPVGKASVQVPILMYHYIRPLPDPSLDRLGHNLSVSPGDFTAQMDWLRDNGFNPVTISDLRAYLDGKRALPGRPVVLTFDDGYLDFYTTAWPILKQHHFKSVAYIVSGFAQDPRTNYMNAEQVREVARAGVEIGSHTVTHADLVRTPPSEVVWQLTESKRVLEGMIGGPVDDFCYPAGRFDPSVVQAVRDAGYQSATTTHDGATHDLNGRFTWDRVRVEGGEPLDLFAKSLASHEDGVAAPTIDPIRLPRTWPLVYVGPLAPS